MPIVSEVLARARELLRGGWTPTPLSTTSAGIMCAPDHEGLANYCVLDALDVAAAGDFDARQAAEDELHVQLGHMGSGVTIERWASEWRFDGAGMRTNRTHGEVLQLFTRAHRHALTKETR